MEVSLVIVIILFTSSTTDGIIVVTWEDFMNIVFGRHIVAVSAHITEVIGEGTLTRHHTAPNVCY